MEDFCRRLPKIELHAHLTGSIRPETLQIIWKDAREKDPSLELGDPVEVLENARKEMATSTFFPLFSKYIYRLNSTPEYITTCTRAVLADFAADGVTYLELRTLPRPVGDLTREGYVSLVLDVIASQPAARRPAAVRLILGVDRKNTADEAERLVELAAKFRARGVVGVDLAGNPAHGADAVRRLGRAYDMARKAGLGVTLHFAEEAASSTDDELRALLDYRPDRLGHAINVPDWAKREIESRKIGLELCLTCNVLAKLIQGGYENHHFGYWRDKGVPIAICTDDCGIFDSTNSNEWIMLMKHFKLSKKEAIDVCRSGVSSIFGGEAEKERLYKALDEFEAAEV